MPGGRRASSGRLHVKRILLSGLLALACAGTAAQAGEGAFYARSGIYGNYIFRGSRVAPVSLISSVGATYSLTDRFAVRGAVWLFAPLAKNTPASHLGLGETDVDLAASYQLLRRLNVSAGWRTYQQSSAVFGTPDSSEVYAGATLDIPWRPSVYVYYDYDNFVGTYVNVSAGNRFPLGENGWSAVLSGAVGFHFGSLPAGGGATVKIDGFNDAVVRTGLEYDLGHGWAIGPAVDWWYTIDNISPQNFRPVPSATVTYSQAF